MDDEQPSLKHHGILGMHWGVRKDDGPSMSLAEQDSAKSWMAIQNKDLSTAEAKAELKKNSQKFAAKFEPSEADGGNSKKGLTDAQKKLLLKAVVGVAVVGGLVVLSKYANKNLIKSVAELKLLAGKEIELSKYKKAVTLSQVKTWGLSGDGFLHPSAFTRPDYTLPKGHVFHRLSGAAEKSFAKSTYATHSTEDYHRYIAIFRHEKIGLELHHITFKTTKPLKVASLTNTLDTLEEVMRRENPSVSKKTVSEAYRSMSGGNWKSIRGQDLFKELKKKGYGAIVDEMDAGVIGESPVVIFAEHLTGKTSKALTAKDIATAESTLIEIRNRKL